MWKHVDFPFGFRRHGGVSGFCFYEAGSIWKRGMGEKVKVKDKRMHFIPPIFLIFPFFKSSINTCTYNSVQKLVAIRTHVSFILILVYGQNRRPEAMFRVSSCKSRMFIIRRSATNECKYCDRKRTIETIVESLDCPVAEVMSVYLEEGAMLVVKVLPFQPPCFR